MKNKYFISLAIIILLGLFLRFYQLGEVPVGFHRDEAHLGFNAYSFLKTAKDLTGNFLPIHVSSFLYSPVGYSYLSIPFIALFGLSEFSVRFVSALFGVLTIWITYFLVKKLFDNRVLALLSSFFIAIAPWHINLSRVTTDNVVVTFLISLGIFIYFHWLKKQKKLLLFLSFLCFSLTLFIYQAPRPFVPLLIPALFILFHPKPWRKTIVLPLILFVVTIIMPIMYVLSSHDLTVRLRMLSIFQHEQTQLVLDEQIREDGANNPLITRFFHNKATSYSTTFIQNYFSFFSYDFLFTDKGFPDRYRVPQIGLLYLFQLPLLIFGIWKMFLKERKMALFLSSWILLAPIGSAITYDDIPNLQRTLFVLPALIIFISYGFYYFWKCVDKFPFSKIVKILVVLVIIYSVFYYLHQYFVHQINHRPWFRQEGYKELVHKINSMESQYDKIIISKAESDPAIFFLFYNNYDPVKLHSELAGSNTLKNFSKYEFVDDPCLFNKKEEINTAIKSQQLPDAKKYLYVSHITCKFISSNLKTISEIKRNDDTTVFRLQIVE